MNTFIILTAAILVIALVWFFTKEPKTTNESAPLTQEDKEWLEAPLETPPTPEPVVEPVAEVVVKTVVEPVVEPVIETVVEPVVEPVVEKVVEPVAEVKPVTTPKKKSTKRYPAKKKPGAAK
jgi:outer membrane biosynthesis protein TonB